MNAQRRKDLNKIYEQLEELKSALESIMEEEQEAYDNLPESLQYSERGERMQEAADNIENAASSIDDVLGYITEATEA